MSAIRNKIRGVKNTVKKTVSAVGLSLAIVGGTLGFSKLVQHQQGKIVLTPKSFPGLAHMYRETSSVPNKHLEKIWEITKQVYGKDNVTWGEFRVVFNGIRNKGNAPNAKVERARSLWENYFNGLKLNERKILEKALTD
jgi:hypothetical protein